MCTMEIGTYLDLGETAGMLTESLSLKLLKLGVLMLQRAVLKQQTTVFGLELAPQVAHLSVDC